jgi:hypothetical protein
MPKNQEPANVIPARPGIHRIGTKLDVDLAKINALEVLHKQLLRSSATRIQVKPNVSQPGV